MDILEAGITPDLIGEDGEPFAVDHEIGVVMSLWDGRIIPLISGGADGDDEGDGDDGADADGDDGDDEDEDDDEADARARETKIRRSAEKKARREMARKNGFANLNEMTEWMSKNGPSARKDDSGSGAGGDGGGSKPPAPAPVPATPAKGGGELLGMVALELVAQGVAPEKARKAAKLVISELDAGDDIDEDDITEAVEALRGDEPGWFPGSSNSDGGGQGKGGRGVPGARRDRRSNGKLTPEEQAKRARERVGSRSTGFVAPAIITN